MATRRLSDDEKLIILCVPRRNRWIATRSCVWNSCRRSPRFERWATISSGLTGMRCSCSRSATSSRWTCTSPVPSSHWTTACRWWARCPVFQAVPQSFRNTNLKKFPGCNRNHAWMQYGKILLFDTILFWYLISYYLILLTILKY